METEIKWSELSSVHLKNIYDYISNDSETYALRFIESLIKSVNRQLILFPDSGREVPEFKSTQFRFLKEVIFKGYRIIYNPSKVPEKITIIAVFNGRMDVLKNKSAGWEIE